MNWKKTIIQEKKMPVLKIKQNWRNTIVEDEAPKVDEKLQQVIDSLNQKIKELKLQLKNELKQSIQKDIKPAKDGLDANRWHDNLDSENEGDFAFVDGEIFKREDGEWVRKFSFKNQQKPIVTVGGVSQQYVADQIAAAIASGGGGGSSNIIASTTSGLTITTEDVLICRGAGGYTITLKAYASATKPVIIKNRTSSDIIIAADVNIDGQSGWTINAGGSFTFAPEGGEYNAY